MTAFDPKYHVPYRCPKGGLHSFTKKVKRKKRVLIIFVTRVEMTVCSKCGTPADPDKLPPPGTKLPPPKR